jgi:hypothetical protein
VMANVTLLTGDSGEGVVGVLTLIGERAVDRHPRCEGPRHVGGVGQGEAPGGCQSCRG